MKRQIIKIDEQACNGCGLCVSACHEGAIALIDGKARLIRDDYCDGLGNCLPVCPTNAISFEEREAAAYDESAVEENMRARKAEEARVAQVLQNARAEKQTQKTQTPHFSGCPGSQARSFGTGTSFAKANFNHSSSGNSNQGNSPSALQHWPVQLKLVPINASYFDGADLLVAADCAAYSYAAFHEDFIRNRVVVIGCPKLDEGDYTEKLTEIIANNAIKSLTIVKMEVPCCGGLSHAATEALRASGKFIPWQIVTLSVDGTRIS